MKISPLKINRNYNFKGHGAGKIKALYMQNAEFYPQLFIYNELRNIGQKHNFDVFIHTDDVLLDEYAYSCDSDGCEYGVWAQDNKTFLNKKDETVIITGLYCREKEAAQKLAEIKNLNFETPELHVEGGNYFVGKKPDGKNYIIVGYEDVLVTAFHYYLKDKLGEVSFDDMNIFASSNKLEKNGKIVADYKDFIRNYDQYMKIALNTFRDTFDVDKKDLTVLSQGQYHNDLVIRPLNYPYVLVNDEKLSEENVKKLRIKHLFSPDAAKFVKDIKGKINEQKMNYASGDKLCNELEEAGFVPIRIGGGYGLCTLNFMNAIVHQDADGLIYITNSCKFGDKNYEYLQNLFEKDLLKKCPQITKVYFVQGAVLGDKSTVTLEYLKRKGGIHCLCAEEMCE